MRWNGRFHLWGPTILVLALYVIAIVLPSFMIRQHNGRALVIVTICHNVIPALCRFTDDLSEEILMDLVALLSVTLRFLAGISVAQSHLGPLYYLLGPSAVHYDLHVAVLQYQVHKQQSLEEFSFAMHCVIDRSLHRPSGALVSFVIWIKEQETTVATGKERALSARLSKPHSASRWKS